MVVAQEKIIPNADMLAVLLLFSVFIFDFGIFLAWLTGVR